MTFSTAYIYDGRAGYNPELLDKRENLSIQEAETLIKDKNLKIVTCSASMTGNLSYKEKNMIEMVEFYRRNPTLAKELRLYPKQ